MSKSNTRWLSAIRLKIPLDIASGATRVRSALLVAAAESSLKCAGVRPALLSFYRAALIAATPIRRLSATYRRHRKCAIDPLPPAGFRSWPLARMVSKYTHSVTRRTI